MNKLLNISALLFIAGAPSVALAATTSPTPGLVLAGECAVGVLAAAGVVLAIVADYARNVRPLTLPVARPASPARRRNAYTFRRGADVARLAVPTASSPACRRAVAASWN